ncbi:MAG TPA: lytic murein transglycosylase [Hyphomicrobiales bacterium]|nr:lytic murein transglycosylase [Hyphomicrobiales bacterium]
MKSSLRFLGLLLCWQLPALAADVPESPTQETSAPDAALPAQDFTAWLNELRSEALGRGIDQGTLDAAFAGVQIPLDRVLELDRNQPEFVQTFTAYMRNRMSDARVARGQRLLVEHADLFSRIEREYGVQPHYLAAFWALESNFGDATGGFSVVNALATLAYDPRRADMFRGELLTALRIIQAGHIQASEMTGSWAGAMGQCQFMPSTFASYAVDGDGDGRIDIWHSLPDVFASAANYLSRSGWKPGERWGREVLLPDDFDFALAGTDVRKSVTEWDALGLRRADGSPLGASEIMGSVILPAGAEGPAFLGYDNFRTIMVWNRSTFYAISVGHLADRFQGAGPIAHMPKVEEQALARADVMELQTRLNELGFDTGEPDGVLGSRTRAAVRDFQLDKGMAADGYASYAFLARLREFSSGSAGN